MANTRWMSGVPMVDPLDGRRNHDVMQVCLNGHVITPSAESAPQFRKDHCSDCGAETITQCPECQIPIRGRYKAALKAAEPPVPNNCHSCGTAYPWRQQALAAAIEVFQLEMDGQDAAAAEVLLSDISSHTPQTELAAYKLKKLISKLGKPAYDVTIKVVADIASAEAKKHLGIAP